MTDARTRIFRQAALDRLSSPEELNRLIALTAPRDWIAAVALLVLIAIAGIWSVFGSVPVRVKGNGIMIATGGRVVDATATGDATVTSILAIPGAVVAKGDTVARLENTELRQSLTNVRAVLLERQARKEALLIQLRASQAALSISLASRKEVLDLRVADANARAKVLEDEVKREDAMFEQRLITWQVVNGSRQALSTAKQTSLEARSEATQIENEEVTARNSAEREVRESLESVADAERHLSELESQVGKREQVLSPIDGRVTEWKVSPGGRVANGQSLLSIEGGVTGLELVLYLPPADGKQILPGMKVWISLSTVKREEYGTLIGDVVEVSAFPSTPQAMMAVLQNDKLVEQLSPGGAPFASRIMLKRDPRNATGYAWTSGKGPPITLTSGSLAEGEVTVSTRTPISYVIPWLKKSTGLEG